MKMKERRDWMDACFSEIIKFNILHPLLVVVQKLGNLNM